MKQRDSKIMRNIKKRFLLKQLILFLVISLMLFSGLIFSSGCSKKKILNPENPVTLTVWHNYGSQMKNLMDEMLDEFNQTIGMEEGIILNVTAISGSQELHNQLIAAAKEDPGAAALPDITTAYPKTAIELQEQDLLIDLSFYFDEKKQQAYVPDFLSEGKLTDDGLYVFPIAKSTEVLFVNKTLFDRFASENNIGYECFETFEGIAEAALKYHEWTSSQSGEDGNGKSFYMPDSLFNLAMVGMKQMDAEFIDASGNLSIGASAYEKIWGNYYTPTILGAFAVFDGYSSDLFKTGDLVCSTGSTAGVLFYPDTITYPDNRQEEVEYEILPYPVYENGKKIALQRGGGMCVTRSTKEKEYAAAVFLEWFTQPEQNLRFTSASGYLPVTQEAFEQLLDNENDNAEISVNILKQRETISKMFEQYEFFYAPHIENYEQIQKDYDANIKSFIPLQKEVLLEKMAEKANYTYDEKIRFVQNTESESLILFEKTYDN